jgi:hypothetical protein
VQGRHDLDTSSNRVIGRTGQQPRHTAWNLVAAVSTGQGQEGSRTTNDCIADRTTDFADRFLRHNWCVFPVYRRLIVLWFVRCCLLTGDFVFCFLQHAMSVPSSLRSSAAVSRACASSLRTAPASTTAATSLLAGGRLHRAAAQRQWVGVKGSRRAVGSLSTSNDTQQRVGSGSLAIEKERWC